MSRWREVWALDANNPVVAAAQYIAFCVWPRNQAKRAALAKALCYVAARKAGHRLPLRSHWERAEKAINRGHDRMTDAFQAAEVAQRALLPALNFNIPVTFERPDRYYLGRHEPGFVRIKIGSDYAIGRHDKPSVKRLCALAANAWKEPDGSLESIRRAETFRKRVWRHYLPVLPYVIPLKLHVEDLYLKRLAELPPGEHDEARVYLMDLVRDPAWLESAMRQAEREALDFDKLQRVSLNLIRLVRAEIPD